MDQLHLRHAPSARLFCERIVEEPAPAGPRRTAVGVDHRPELVPAPVAVRPDHPGDARDARRHRGALRRRRTPTRLWARLTDDAKPAIWFQLLPDRRDGRRRGPLHQDELAREAAHRVRGVQGPPRPVVADAGARRRLRAQDRRRLDRPPLAVPRRQRHRRRRVHALLRLPHRGVRVARGPGPRRRGPHARAADQRAPRPAATRAVRSTSTFICEAFDVWVGEPDDRGRLRRASSRPQSTATGVRLFGAAADRPVPRLLRAVRRDARQRRDCSR